MQQVDSNLKLPVELQYESIVPKGYPSIYKQWINDPLTGNKTWANNDIIRWNFMNGGKGVFDPYRSFIQITVSTDATSLPVGLLQVDNSAHSFINQIVLYSDNRQIQRITQYDVLLAYLNDIGMNQFLSQGKQTQGLGYGNVENVPLNTISNSQNAVLRSISCTNGTIFSPSVGIVNSTGNLFPTIGNSFPQPPFQPSFSSVFAASKTAKGHVTAANVCVFGTDLNSNNDQSQTAIQAALSQSGYANNIRAQYNLSFMTSKFPQHSQCTPNYQLKLSQSVSNGVYPFFFSPTVPYLTTVSSTVQQLLAYGSTTTSGPNQQNVQALANCNNFGYSTPYSPFFTKGTFQPFISATVPQCAISQGVFASTKFPIWQKTFKIPLASSIIGCAIDPSSYCLIPLQSINDLLLQLTLDPYAMFTSGYCDVSQYDTVGSAIQQKRNWTVQRLQYKLHTYYFIDQQVQKYIKASLYKEITIVSNFWSLGNQYQIPGGTQVNNTYIVGCSSTNLNEIVCLFVANDYQKFSFCRKHFRLSNNIKRFWSKLAVDYWPPQPFKGNGGNAMSNNINDDNSIFIQNLYWANNYVFNKNSLPRLNIYNFALNQRCYDPTVVSTFYDPASLNNPKYSNWGLLSCNGDTAMGMPYFHQNRVVGKAAYIIVYTPFTQQQGLLNGIDVSGLSNFQVVFQTQSTNVFPRDQTLYIYCKSSVIVKYSKDGIRTIGR